MPSSNFTAYESPSCIIPTQRDFHLWIFLIVFMALYNFFMFIFLVFSFIFISLMKIFYIPLWMLHLGTENTCLVKQGYAILLWEKELHITTIRVLFQKNCISWQDTPWIYILENIFGSWNWRLRDLKRWNFWRVSCQIASKQIETLWLKRM